MLDGFSNGEGENPSFLPYSLETWGGTGLPTGIVAPTDFLSLGRPKATWLLAPLDFLRAVPPKNIVPVIVTSEDSASRVTSITVRSPPEAVRLRPFLGCGE